MSKEEQFDHIEKKIREAVENNQPSFDEKAWLKMETLLDKHDPKRRYFIWIWLSLISLVLGSIAVIYLNNNKLPSYSYRSGKSIPQGPARSPISNNKSSGFVAKEHTQKNQVPSVSPKPSSSKSGTHSITSNLLVNKGKQNIIVTLPAPEGDEELQSPIPTSIPSHNLTHKEDSNTSSKELSNIEKPIIEKEISLIPHPDSLHEREKKPTESKLKQTKKSRFYLLAALGPDVGSVRFLSFDKSRLAARYGGSVGFQINNKWSIQAGFYAATKKYIAGPGDYDTKNNPYWNNYKITSVDAECTIYELPITARYNVIQKKKHTFFTTLGLASYFMQKENYHYYYLRYNMPAETYYSYTGNRHYVSNVNISMGGEIALGKSLALILEPYWSLPLKGVGEGKVKLFSAGIMTGLKFQPEIKIPKKTANLNRSN